MKTNFDEKNVRPGLMGIVLLSHGPLAMGALASAEMIYGEADLENVVAFSLEEGDDMGEYAQSFDRVLNAYAGNCLFLIDFLGGSPCNQLRLYAMQRQVSVRALLGMNMPMLFYALDQRRCGDTAAQIEADALAEGRNGVRCLFD